MRQLVKNFVQLVGGKSTKYAYLHDGGSIVRDDGLAVVVYNQLVHAAGAQRRADLATDNANMKD